MEPIKYVDELNNHYRSLGHPVYRWTVNSTAPLHRIDKPLAECTVAILTTGGISQCNMSPFNPNSHNDHRLDAIDKDTADDEFQIHDAYYNHDDADRDRPRRGHVDPRAAEANGIRCSGVQGRERERDTGCPSMAS